jgi:hypothetical protein
MLKPFRSAAKSLQTAVVFGSNLARDGPLFPSVEPTSAISRSASLTPYSCQKGFCVSSKISSRVNPMSAKSRSLRRSRLNRD